MSDVFDELKVSPEIADCLRGIERDLRSAYEEALASETKRREEAERERDALRQAHWDGRAIGGFDNDGDPTPGAVVSDFCDLIRQDWRDARERRDELMAENAALEEEVKRMTRSADACRADASRMGERALAAEAEVKRIRRAGRDLCRASAKTMDRGSDLRAAAESRAKRMEGALRAMRAAFGHDCDHGDECSVLTTEQREAQDAADRALASEEKTNG